MPGKIFNSISKQSAASGFVVGYIERGLVVAKTLVCFFQTTLSDMPEDRILYITQLRAALWPRGPN